MANDELDKVKREFEVFVEALQAEIDEKTMVSETETESLKQRIDKLVIEK
jgi:hypothetical protein